MGRYLLLSDPAQGAVLPNYKGLDRMEPIPTEETGQRFLALWYRYVETEFLGVTTELSLSELQELAALASQTGRGSFEVIYFDSEPACPHPAVYYGADVVGVGGYSMLSEGLFRTTHKSDHTKIFQALNRFFLGNLNECGLFSRTALAEHLRDVLKEINVIFPAEIEVEDWQVVHVYKVI